MKHSKKHIESMVLMAIRNGVRTLQDIEYVMKGTASLSQVRQALQSLRRDKKAMYARRVKKWYLIKLNQTINKS